MELPAEASKSGNVMATNASSPLSTTANKNYTKIVLSGGPRAGKSTCLQLMTDRLKSLGFQVFVAVEAATTLMSTGIHPMHFKNEEEVYDFQIALARFQLLFENYLVDKAKHESHHTVIICDRGLMDGKAYMPEHVWRRLLQDLDLSEDKICSRYDAVLFLRTSASGDTEQLYKENLKDNSIRIETPEEAAALDQRSLNVWSVHHKVRIIRSEFSFESKCRNVIKAIERVMGVPMPADHRRKYLLSSLPVLPEGINVTEFWLEQTFLNTANSSRFGGDTEVRLIRRSQEGSNDTFTVMAKKVWEVSHSSSMGEKIETERSLTKGLYIEFIDQEDKTRRRLNVHRRCFLVGDSFFKVDEYTNVPANSVFALDAESQAYAAGVKESTNSVFLLQLSTDSDPKDIVFPDYLKPYIVRDVTDSKAFTSYQLALTTLK